MINKRLLTAAAITILGIITTACANNNMSAQNGVAVAQEEVSSEINENTEENDRTEVVDGVEIVNSYENTDELMEKFPVINKTELRTDLEKDIANRLLTGFENWNRGFDAWKAWGSILYTDDSIYNVHGARLTLDEYQAAMDVTLKQMDLKMGNFNNMLIVDDWAAIYYDITTNGKPGTTMEFVKFNDFGDELGVRVDEGWGGPKDKSYENMSYFQTENEAVEGENVWHEIADYQISDADNLEEKYIVKNPTTVDDNDLMIKDMLLENFEHWNNGLDDWNTWADQFYSDEAVYHRDGKDFTLEELKASVKQNEQTVKTTKLYFDNMLIRDGWAAIHYREMIEDKVTGKKEASDRMEFLHFNNSDGEYKVAEHWVK